MIQNTIDVTYKIKFTNKEPVPIETIVQSLLAYEKIIKRVTPFVEVACDGIVFDDIEVLLAKIEAGSVLEDLVVRFLFKDEKTYNQAKEVLEKMAEGNKVLTTAVCFGVAAYVGFGIYNAVVSQKGATAPTTHIEAHRGAIVQTGGVLNISEEVMQDILNKVTDKKTLSKEAITAISPAHLEEGVTIEFNESDEMAIKPEFIKEAPPVYETPELEQDNEVLLNVPIEIWASDRESSSKTWAGTVPGTVDKRVKFSLHESIDPNALHGSRQVNADVMIIRQLQPQKKEFIPMRIEILKVY